MIKLGDRRSTRCHLTTCINNPRKKPRLGGGPKRGFFFNARRWGERRAGGIRLETDKNLTRILDYRSAASNGANELSK